MLTSVQGVENVTYEAGYVDWEMDMEQRLYVEGDDAETSVLQRERPDAILAFAEIEPTSNIVPIFSLTSETRPPEVKSIRSPHPRAQVIGFVLCVGFASTAFGFEVKHRLPSLLQEQSARMSTAKR